jgi:hypothetical protein
MYQELYFNKLKYMRQRLEGLKPSKRLIIK